MVPEKAVPLLIEKLSDKPAVMSVPKKEEPVVMDTPTSTSDPKRPAPSVPILPTSFI